MGIILFANPTGYCDKWNIGRGVGKGYQEGGFKNLEEQGRNTILNVEDK